MSNPAGRDPAGQPAPHRRADRRGAAQLAAGVHRRRRGRARLCRARRQLPCLPAGQHPARRSRRGAPILTSRAGPNPPCRRGGRVQRGRAARRRGQPRGVQRWRRDARDGAGAQPGPRAGLGVRPCWPGPRARPVHRLPCRRVAEERGAGARRAGQPDGAERTRRTRAAIVQALFELTEAGELKPSGAGHRGSRRRRRALESGGASCRASSFLLAAAEVHARRTLAARPTVDLALAAPARVAAFAALRGRELESSRALRRSVGLVSITSQVIAQAAQAGARCAGARWRRPSPASWRWLRPQRGAGSSRLRDR